MAYISYVSGSEQHSSSWGKFYVKGLEAFVVKEEHEANAFNRHANFQCWEGFVPEGTVFTIFEQSGDKYGVDTWKFAIAVAGDDEDSPIPPDKWEAHYGSGELSGNITILCRADGKVYAPRLMGWWTARPANADSVAYARHCAQHITRRGLKAPPPMEGA